MRKLLTGLMILLLIAIAVPVSLAQDNGDSELPDLIEAARPDFHPEGVEWYEAGGFFLTGSLTEGTIFSIEDDGTVTPFIEDDKLSATIGIHIDEDRLLVANSDAAALGGGSGFAQLGIYDLESGDELAFVDLGSLLEEGRHFANDVTADDEGNAYVTDSFSPVIYKVTPDGEASIFLQDDTFAVEGFGLNGIDYHPDGYLVVALAGNAELYKIPVDDPESFSKVELSEPIGGDGIIFDEDNNLVVVATTFDDEGNSMSEIVKLSSDDDWASAQVVARGTAMPEASPTTAAIRDGAIYVVHAHFATLQSSDSTEVFEIMRVELEPTDAMNGDMEDENMDDAQGQDTEDDSGDEAMATEEVSG